MTMLDSLVLAGPPPLSAFARPALFLDLDGTLASIQPRPSDVKPEAWRTRLLAQMRARLGGRLAVISGRTLEEVDDILEGSVPVVAAVHGLVRRGPDGAISATLPPPGLDGALSEATALERRLPGVTVEPKGPSLALHYRQAPDLARQAVDAAEAIGARWSLRVQPGDMVVELCAPGQDKGTAVLAFMASAPFRGATPLFVGDDLTDEAGFEAAASLGGIGVLVGGPRETAAKARLADVDAVRAWLEQGLAAGPDR